jgi:hypothetical protein
MTVRSGSFRAFPKLTMRLVNHGRWNVAGNWRGYNYSLSWAVLARVDRARGARGPLALRRG